MDEKWDGFLVLASGLQIGMLITRSGEIVWDQHAQLSNFGPAGPLDETPCDRKRIRLGPAAGDAVTGESRGIDRIEGESHAHRPERVPPLQSCLAAFKAGGHTTNGAIQKTIDG